MLSRGFFAAVCLALLTVATAAQEELYAAIDANNEDSSVVAWDSTKEGADKKAVEACKRVSKTCSGRPSYTNTLDDTFAYMCCQRPRFGCSIGVGAKREDAIAMVRKTFSDAGFSECSPPRYISARTGKKLN